MTNPKSRAIFTCVCMVLLFSVFSARLIHLQVTRHEEFSALAAEKHVVKKPVFAQRGQIIDAQGEILADNISVKTVYADASHIKKTGPVAEIVARRLDLDLAEVQTKLQRKSQYIVLKKEVDQLTAHALEQELAEKSLRGIYFLEDFQRVYPNGEMLSHVIGFLDHEHRGLTGIERSMDQYLQGHDGYRYTERDRTGKEIVLYRGQERPAQDGYTVQSTVNLALQNLVENELRAAAAKYKPKGATIIMMEPRTGAILAMASWPTFDVNNANNVAPEVTKNHAILDMVEPGSTFKIVATAAALEEGTVKDDTLIYCEAGRYQYGGRILRDHHPYGSMNVHDILMKSSNIGVAKLALQLGDQRFYEYVRKFGFGERTGIDLPGEIPGIVHQPYKWDKLTITRMPMGHAVSVTPIQLCSAMSVIANGGNLMMPQVVSSIIAKDGTTVSKWDPVKVRQVIRPEIAAKINDGLVSVVSKTGTAPSAAVLGFRVAGKTGTAQIPNPNGPGYLEGKYNVSFCGYMPAENPAFVAYVLVIDPTTEPGLNYGGTVAAPIFSSLAGKAARYFDLQPDPALMADQLKFVSHLKNEKD